MSQAVVRPAAVTDRFRAGKRLWTLDEEAIVRARYPHELTATIAGALRRTVVAVYQRAQQLGLEKSAAFRASPEGCRMRRGGRIGARFRFPKGHVPANKGVRRPGWSPGRMRETQFKTGMRSGLAAQRWMPVGSTRLIEGYVYRKVSDVPNVAYTVNWKPEHYLIWTAVHGPVPRGHVLSFLNGDKTDVRLENMACITRGRLMARNSVHTLPKPLARAVQLLGALNRQIRRKTSHAEQR